METDHAAEGERKESDGQGESLGLVSLIGSALAAGFGVQSSKNRERDFTQGRASAFVAVGIVFTLLFMGTIYTVVRVVLASR